MVRKGIKTKGILLITVTGRWVTLAQAQLYDYDIFKILGVTRSLLRVLPTWSRRGDRGRLSYTDKWRGKLSLYDKLPEQEIDDAVMARARQRS